MTLSVIICTYNPESGVFSRCLDAIAAANANSPFTELIIVDNNSTNGFHSTEAVKAFLRNHPARIIKENQQGLTPARLRGIREASGDLLVFIDDDNFIAADFLQRAKEIAGGFPQVGAFSGQVLLEYDSAPDPWTMRYRGMLVYREFSGNRWSTEPFDQSCMPCGAGLCIRKEVAGHYLALHESGKRNFNLDRSVNSLLSGGDNDLAMCACDIGLGMGLFDSLVTRHYIPAKRFQLDYLAKLAYGIYYSEKLLKFMRLHRIEKIPVWKRARTWLRTLMTTPRDGRINRACLKGATDTICFA